MAVACDFMDSDCMHGAILILHNFLLTSMHIIIATWLSADRSWPHVNNLSAAATMCSSAKIMTCMAMR